MALDPALVDVLGRYDVPLQGASARKAESGLIQLTYLVELGDGRRVVLQRMHPVFGAPVLDDMDAITRHLERRGLPAPRIIPARDGVLGVTSADGRLWRLLTWLPGFTIDRVTDAHPAREAARLVARFHRAVDGLDYQFRFTRAGVHDTAGHLGKLAARGGEVPDGERLARLRDDILATARQLPEPAGFAGLPRRIAHGDLKISNVLFMREGDEPPRAHALIDLDTLGRMPLAHELGDAWRSWCNPRGEDVEAAIFDLEIFAAAVEGYAEHARDLPAREEIESLVPGVATICVELAARFCVDAFDDSYFGWDPVRFPSRREHNRVRAAGQLSLARAVLAARTDAEAIVSRAFALA